MSDVDSPKTKASSSDAAKSTSSTAANAAGDAASRDSSDVEVNLAALNDPAPARASTEPAKRPATKATDPTPSAVDERPSVPAPSSTTKSSERPSSMPEKQPAGGRGVELSSSEQRKLEDIRRKLKDIFVTAEKREPASDTVKAGDQQTVSSGLLDLRDLAKMRHGAAGSEKVDDDIRHLSGGLFGGARNSSAPLDAPDITRPTPPPKPPPPVQAVRRPVEEIAVEVETETETETEPEPALRNKLFAKPVITSAPVVAEPIVTPSAGLSGRTLVALTLGGALLFGTVFFMVMRGGGDDSTATPSSAATVSTDSQPEQGQRVGQPAPQNTPTAQDPGSAAVAPGGPAASDKKSKDDKSDDKADSKAKPSSTKGSTDPKAPGDTKEPVATGPKTVETAATPPATPPPAAEAPKPPPPPAADEFDATAARSAMNAAATRAMGCKGDGPSGTAQVSVTFAPSGRVTSARIESGPFSGTPTGGCIATAFRSATVPPFSGSPITVRKTVSIR